MAEIVPKNSDDFQKLLDKCRQDCNNLLNDMKNKCNFAFRREQLIAKYRIGETILSYKSHLADVSATWNFFISELSKQLELPHQRVSELIAFKELVDKENGSLENFIKKHDEGLEYPSWYEITHLHLPQNALEDNLEKFKIIWVPASKFEDEENLKAFYGQDAVVEGIFYKLKIKAKGGEEDG